MTGRISILVLGVEPDRAKGSAIAETLAGPGLEVAYLVVDRKVPKADCVVLCWSQAAVHDVDFQRAAAATSENRRVDVMLARGLLMAGPTWLDVSRWQGKSGSQSLFALRDRARFVASTGRRRRQIWGLGWSAVIVAGVILGVLSDWDGALRKACSVPGIRQGICAPQGWGGVPSPAQERQYEEAKAAGCDGLRAFVARFSTNPRVEEARRLIDARRLVSKGIWAPDVRSAELFIAGPALPSKGEAAEAANVAALQRSQSLCAGFPQKGWRALPAEFLLDPPDCQRSSDGWRCNAPGRAICRGHRYRTEDRESCAE